MNNVEKLRIMLQHWIEHNKGHMDEFERWRGIMLLDGQSGVADRLGQTLALMNSVNEQLHQALHEMGGAGHSHDHDHEHDHGHHHGGGHHHH